MCLSKDSQQAVRCMLLIHCRQIIVRGLPIEMTNDDLWDYFRPFGPIAYVKVTYDHVTGVSRRFAFVEFEKDITVDQVRVDNVK